MRRHDRLADVQAQSVALETPSALHAIKPLEQARQLLGGDPEPLVAHAHCRRRVVTLDGYGDWASVGGVLDGVGQKVLQYLLEPGPRGGVTWTGSARLRPHG